MALNAFAPLDDDELEMWLDPAARDLAALQHLLRPCPDDLLSAYPVSRSVNDPRHEGPALAAPVAEAVR